jgi:pimeloyl-ACP methyl ester carboxylesterase
MEVEAGMTIAETELRRAEREASFLARATEGGFAALQSASPQLAAALGHKLFFTPPHPPLRRDEADVLKAASRQQIGRGAGRALAHIFGEGHETVFLMHGWGGHAGHMSAFVAPLIASGRQVVALDLPGHGRARSGYSSLVLFADALAEATARFGPLGGVIAHSFGAAASVLAMRRGLELERAVFIAPPARLDPFWARFRGRVGMTPQVWERLVAIAEQRIGMRFADMHPADLARDADLPLLVLHGTRDEEVPSAQGAELAAAWPGAIFESVPDAGHLRLLKDRAVTRRAAQFLIG